MNPKILLGLGLFSLLALGVGVVIQDTVLILLNSISLILIGYFGQEILK